MKKASYIIGVTLFLLGFIASFAQKESGAPAPFFQLGGCALMLAGGKLVSNTIKKEDE